MTVEGFNGNHKTDDYVVVVSNLIESYQNLGCDMSLKLFDTFFVFSQEIFCDNSGDVIEEMQNASTKTFK